MSRPGVQTGNAKDLFLGVADGLKKLYAQKIKPVEQGYLFDQFYSPLMGESDFEAKPMVMLLGQYSVGKTTFIRYLLGQDFPGAHIGPEPTTDKFMAIFHGPEERLTPGNALAVQADKPFRGLQKFGTGFLNKFAGSQVQCELLEHITFIDTPGVLAGEKQRIGRSYEFTEVIEWMAERVDMILLLFDAHKLDISDEFRRAIDVLKGHDDKVRVVLNKADMVSSQQLMRVYGALMWSLGKVIKTPEVMRVYIGSFWDQPLRNEDNRPLFEAEMRDLIADLKSLPKNNAMRKVNELVKRSRLAKAHALLLGHLKNEMPSFFGKEKAQKKLIDNLADEFNKVRLQYQLPISDFPNIEKFKQVLQFQDFDKFPKTNLALIQEMDTVLAVDIPELLRRFPVEPTAALKASQSALGNPFAEASMFASTSVGITWQLTDRDYEKYASIFAQGNPTVDGKLSGAQMKPLMQQSKLPPTDLLKIWALSDLDRDGFLDLDEFCICMYIINTRMCGLELPPTLPESMVPASKRPGAQHQPQQQRAPSGYPQSTPSGATITPSTRGYPQPSHSTNPSPFQQPQPQQQSQSQPQSKSSSPYMQTPAPQAPQLQQQQQQQFGFGQPAPQSAFGVTQQPSFGQSTASTQPTYTQQPSFGQPSQAPQQASFGQPVSSGFVQQQQQQQPDQQSFGSFPQPPTGGYAQAVQPQSQPDVDNPFANPALWSVGNDKSGGFGGNLI